MKHNKKRNTAFLFEALVTELTKAIMEGDIQKKSKTQKLIHKYFRRGTNLYEELQLYKALSETTGLEKIVAEKLIFEVKMQRKHIADSSIFGEQTGLIKDMNKEYTKSVFSNFVPNYKSLATLAQIFNSSVSVKERVLMESSIIGRLVSTEEPKEEKMVPIDNLVYKTFVEKFNSKYSDTLAENQKALLSKYISSFADNGLELKMFLNEEIGRLKSLLVESLANSTISSDIEMKSKTQKIIDELEGYASKKINDSMIKSILKVQGLERELSN
tara:strand:+ start:845 stop:1660 length:816 start_codon:yes stop_codon:yes gene_type:complete